MVTGRNAGADVYQHTLDLPGFDDGAGSASVQDGDGLAFHAGAATWRPKRRPGLAFADLMALVLIVSDPPTQAEVQSVADRLDVLLARLQGL